MRLDLPILGYANAGRAFSSEVEAMTDFISSTDINMIQFRNLNIDPEEFMKLMAAEKSEAYGMLNLLTYIKECFPEIVIGNFSVGVNSVK